MWITLYFERATITQPVEEWQKEYVTKERTYSYPFEEGSEAEGIWEVYAQGDCGPSIGFADCWGALKAIRVDKNQPALVKVGW